MSFFLRLRSWLKDSRKIAGSKTRRVRYRPLVEELEDRCLLSTGLPATVSATPIFNEDFNQPVGSLPLTSTWTYATGSDPNNTAVAYVDNASTLSVVNDPNASDGKALAMTIYPTSAGNQSFDSARINTAGDPAGNVEYGLIEASIKLPGGPNGQGDGLWPAFWMLGSDHQTGVGWPNCGEIDIMEQGAGGPSIINGSTHFGSLTARQDTTATYTLPGGQAFYSSYHTFAVYWTPGSITFSVDGIPYDTVARSSYSASLWDQTFDQPFYLILNICDGGPNNSGGFGGPVTANSTFPQTMDVDYVRAYSLTGISTPTNFTATASGPNTVDLSWQDPLNDDTGFVLQRSTTANFATINATINLAQATTSYQDTTASAGTTYYYRLLAVATDGTHNYQSGYTSATVATTGAASPVITSGAAPTIATVGSAYSYKFTATGSPTPTLSASGMPNWLTFTSTTGVLSGTPAAANAGTSTTITLTANNGVSPAATMTFTVQVATQATPALVVSPSTLNLGTTTVGTAGTAQTFTVSGSDLTSNLDVNGLAGVELSSNGTTYSSSLALAANAAGTVASTTIWARIAGTASAGTIGGDITVASAGATTRDIAVTGTVSAGGPPTPIGNTLYLLSETNSAPAGTLSAQAGSGAEVDTIPSAGGTNHDGTLTNPLVFVISGLTGTYNSAAKTQFALFVDAGTSIANGTQIRISYDFNGDGVYDRVETYHYFAEDNLVGWQTYTRAAGLESATGSFANFVNGSIEVEIWNAIGKAPVSLRTNASASNGLQSVIQIPFTNLTQSGPTSPAVTPVSSASVSAYDVIQAQSFSSSSGVSIDPTTGTGAGEAVGPLANGAWLLFQDVDFGASSPTTVEAMVASGVGPGISGEISFHLDSPDGPEIGSFCVGSTGGWQSWQTIAGNISGATGVHDLYVEFYSGQPAAFVDLSWIIFGPAPTAAPAATSS